MCSWWFKIVNVITENIGLYNYLAIVWFLEPTYVIIYDNGYNVTSEITSRTAFIVK